MLLVMLKMNSTALHGKALLSGHIWEAHLKNLKMKKQL